MRQRIPLLQTRLPRAYFHATILLLVLNLLVFLVTELSPRWLLFLGMTPVAVIEHGAWWQLVTYLYAHVNFNHIAFNMVGLVLFGLAVEEELGSWEFLLFYHLTGALAALAWLGIYWITGQYDISLIGASAAVFALALAFAAYRPRARILFIRARNLVILYVCAELLFQLFDPYGGVAHLAHLAGFVFAFFYLMVRLRVNAWSEFWA